MYLRKATLDFPQVMLYGLTKNNFMHTLFQILGDIVYMDEKGYIYFKDRTGDTFRWKGENVSTTEVESAINKTIGLKDVSVYGVEIPSTYSYKICTQFVQHSHKFLSFLDTDGRAGMAAIMDDNVENDVKSLSENLKDKLPSYARPLFLRFCHTFETTGKRSNIVLSTS